MTKHWCEQTFDVSYLMLQDPDQSGNSKHLLSVSVLDITQIKNTVEFNCNCGNLRKTQVLHNISNVGYISNSSYMRMR